MARRKLKFQQEGRKMQFFLPFDMENFGPEATKDSKIFVGFVKSEKEIIGGMYFDQKNVKHIIIEEN